MSKFKKPSELAVKPVPSGAGVQHQSYSVVVQGGKKDVSDLRSTFKDKPQAILNNSKADFQPVDGDGNKLEHANLQKGSYIDIAIDGPLNNSIVKVTDETSDADGFSMTFGTLEGHVEAGQITFSATQNEDGSVTFGINSTSKVDNGTANAIPKIEKHARESQQQSWNEVLTNVVKYLQGSEHKRRRTLTMNFYLFSGVIPSAIILASLYFYKPLDFKKATKALTVSLVPLVMYIVLVSFLESIDSLNLGWATYTLVFFFIPYLILVLILNGVAWNKRRRAKA
jgi:hypothetical protein